MQKDSLFYIIVDRGKANKILSHAKECNAKEGTIFFGEGTIKSGFLDWLGINQTYKEILIVTVQSESVPELIEMLKAEFRLHKKFKGIAFSVPVLKWTPGTNSGEDFNHEACKEFPYFCLMTIINKGKGKECIEKAREAGAIGGTIIHAHGAGVPQDFYFPLIIEPQKEIVLMVIAKDKLVPVRRAVFEGMGLDKRGNGILLTLPVLETVGLYENQKQRRAGIK